MKEKAFAEGIKELIRRAMQHEVPQRGSQLAYSFLFALFPALICVNGLIGLLEIDMGLFLDVPGVIPEEVQHLIRMYLSDIGGRQSAGLILTGLVLSVYSAVTAVGTLIKCLNLAEGTKESRPLVRLVLTAAFFTGLLMVQLVLGIVLLVAGEYLLTFIGYYVPALLQFEAVWRVLSFSIVAAIGFITLTLLYSVAPDCRLCVKTAWPGAALATAAWLLASAVFSFYASNMASYSVVYGSLGAIIVLMMWFFITGIILILGGEVNAVLQGKRIGARRL